MELGLDGAFFFLFFHEIGFRPAIYYIATGPTIQEFEIKKMLGSNKYMPNKKEMKTTVNR
jgi:hypothetical protein